MSSHNVKPEDVPRYIPGRVALDAGPTVDGVSRHSHKNVTTIERARPSYHAACKAY